MRSVPVVTTLLFRSLLTLYSLSTGQEARARIYPSPSLSSRNAHFLRAQLKKNRFQEGKRFIAVYDRFTLRGLLQGLQG